MNRTKKAIFEAAINVFATSGYNGSTVDEIASKANVAKGTLYYNFKSKEEIFNFVIICYFFGAVPLQGGKNSI